MRPVFVRSLGFGVMVASGAALPSEALADTTIPAGTRGAETWTKAGSPYLVEGDVTLESLTVQSGTVVRAVGTAQIFFFVNGPLTVTGSSTEPVVFEGDGAQGRWGTIQAQSASIAYATLKDAQQLQLTSSSATSVIRECTLDRILVHPLGSLDVDRSLFLVGSAGILVGSSATAVTTVANSVFDSQSSSRTGYGMDVSGKATITNSTFDGLQAALYVNSNDVVVRNSIFTNSTRVAMRGVPTVSYSLFWNVTAEGPTSDPLEGTGIVRADPKYASATDFRVLPSSPAIDSGTSDGAPDHDFSGQPRPQGKGFDMGAYELVAMAGMGGAGGSGGSGGGASGGAGNVGGAGGTSAGEGGESSGGEPGDTGGTGDSGGTGGDRDGGLGGGGSPQGGSMTGGVSGAETGGGVGGSGEAGRRSSTVETSGCGCRQSRPGSAGSLAALAVAAMLWARGRRRV